MPTRVQLPDGSIGEFPDGMPESQIEAVLQKQYGGPDTSGPARPGVPAAPLPAGLTGPRDTRNTLQQEVDADAESDSPQQVASQSSLETGLDALGHGFTRALVKPAVHPLDTLKGLANTAADLGDANMGNYRPNNFVANTIDAEGKKFKTEPLKQAIPDTLGEIGGMVTGGKAMGAAGDAVKSAALPTGDALQTLGARNMTRILDQGTTAAVRDARTGVNPGESMLKSGIGTSLTKRSLATKIAAAKDATGQMIGDAVERADQNALAPPISPRQTAPAIRGPVNEAIGRVTGPGGTASTSPYEDLAQSMTRTAPGASSPIFGPEAPEEILPSDLWKTIRNVDANTRFNTDPEVESVNEARRDIRGNLRPLLEQTDPTIKPLSRNYSGLSSAGDAMERTAGRSAVGINPSILHNLSTNTPLNTGVSSALFKIGGGLRRLGGASEGSVFPGFAAKQSPFYPRLSADTGETILEPGGADFSEGGFPARDAVITRAPEMLKRLPSTAGAGDLQPMVWERAESHPGVASDFSRMRVAPTKGQLNRMPRTVLPPEHHGLALPSPETLALPAVAGAGDLQPMIAVKAPSKYPPLAEDFARTRIVPNTFKGPSSNMLKGLLPKRASRARYKP